MNNNIKTIKEDLKELNIFLNIKFVISVLLQIIIIYILFGGISKLIDNIMPELDKKKNIYLIFIEIILQLTVNALTLLFSKKITSIVLNRIDNFDDKMSGQITNTSMAVTCGIFYMLQKKLSLKQRYLLELLNF
jgi:hypothetical protein